MELNLPEWVYDLAIQIKANVPLPVYIDPNYEKLPDPLVQQVIRPDRMRYGLKVVPNFELFTLKANQ